MKSLEEFFGKKPIVPSVKIPNAEKSIREGLKYFCGEDYTWLPCYNNIACWAMDNAHRGLLFLGDYGTGKTLIACRILMPLINYYWQKEYLGDEDHWLKRYPASGMVEAYENGRSMIIDDLGVEDISNNYGEKIDYFARIIDKVEFNGRLLICTTNLNAEELKKRYGMRVWDRMRALMQPVVFDNHGKSLR